MNKHIVCFIDNLDSGGAQRQIIGLATMLQEKRYKVEIIDYYQITFWDNYLKDKNIKFTHLICNENSSWSKLVAVWKYLDNTKPTHVIAYLSSPTIIAAIYKIFHWKKIKLISSDRNTDLSINIFTKIKYFLYKFADWIVPNSHTQGDILKKYDKTLEKKIKVITNFVDLEKFQAVDADTLVKNRNKLIAVGRIAVQKDTLTLLKAINILKDENLNFHIDWYGRPNPQSYYDECIDYIKQNPGIERYITFFDHINDIEKKYREYGALILSSIFEGYPNVVGEAMSCGLPILCTAVCDNVYMVKDGDNGYTFPSKDEKALAATIRKFLSIDDNKIMEISKNNLDYAHSVLNPDTFIASYIVLLQ